MNKNDFLREFESELNRYNVSNSEIKEYINDYNELLTDSISKSDNEESAVTKYGQPHEIARELVGDKGYKIDKRNKIYEKITGLVVFFCVITYLIVGFIFDTWHPTWLVFMLIPISGVLFTTDTNINEKIPGLTVFMCVITYVLLGYFFNLWHPAWLIFFLIPLTGLMLDINSKNITSIVLMILGVTSYIFLYFINDSLFNLLVFVPFKLNQISIYDIKNFFRVFPLIKIVAIISVSLFLIIGYLTNIWHPTWIVLLSIPLVSTWIFAEGTSKYIAISPFISVILYIIIGELSNAWAISSLVFFLIPISGVILSEH